MSAPPTLAIRRRAISTLVPDPANPRSHGEENIAAIVASIRRFGQVEPLLIQKRTGRVVAGHGRLVAMRQLGCSGRAPASVAYLYADLRTGGHRAGPSRGGRLSRSSVARSRCRGRGRVALTKTPWLS